MNYKGILRDVFTLCHEGGHSMHSHYSKKQPYHYANYPIFVAEVASTFNEELLFHELFHRCGHDEELRASILNSKLDDLAGTLFRQTLFAEFELFIHERAERGEPLTPRILNEKYLELVKWYYGDDLVLHELMGVEWARIPHFYYNFYVYQYATGISAAHALSTKVLLGTKKEREEYLSFLQSGGSLFPVELLKEVNVDMTSGEPVEKTLMYFSTLLDKFEAHFAR
jgi:oligoendopeptidase F